MRIAIIAPGSRGDVQPYIALGKGLLEAGHVVRLVANQDFDALVGSHGLEFWSMGGHAQDVAQSAEMSELLEKGKFLAILSLMAKEAERGTLSLAQGGLAACQSMDLVIAGIGGVFIGAALAEKLGIQLLQAYYIPFTPTRAHASFLLPGQPSWLGGGLNRVSHFVARQVMWQSFRSSDGKARREVLDLPAAPLLGPYNADCLHPAVLYGYSPSVIPKPPDWGDDIHVTGYWFLDEADDWTPPPVLTEFLETGSPPVYVGFGSMSSRKPEETVELILRALAQAGQRGIVLSGWGGLDKADVPDSVLMIDSAPFSWLFPRVAAVVHHGGAGTTSAGLRAGVPSVVVPFFGDQPFWAQRVAGLGVGPAPIPRKRLTVERLARAIHEAVVDEGMRERAARLGAQIQAEDGVAQAVAVVEGIEERRVA